MALLVPIHVVSVPLLEPVAANVEVPVNAVSVPILPITQLQEQSPSAVSDLLPVHVVEVSSVHAIQCPRQAFESADELAEPDEDAYGKASRRASAVSAR